MTRFSQLNGSILALRQSFGINETLSLFRPNEEKCLHPDSCRLQHAEEFIELRVKVPQHCSNVRCGISVAILVPVDTLGVGKGLEVGSKDGRDTSRIAGAVDKVSLNPVGQSRPVKIIPSVLRSVRGGDTGQFREGALRETDTRWSVDERVGQMHISVRRLVLRVVYR